MKRKDTLYCIYCKEENSKKNIWCSKCKKLIWFQRHPLIDYIFNNTKDNIIDETSGNIFDFIKDFLISHLYGISLAATLLFTTAAIVLNNIGDKENNPNINYVSERLELKKLATCDNLDTKEMNYICPSGYTIKDQECIKVNSLKAKENNTCDEGYEYVDKKCVSIESSEPEKSYTCETPKNWTYDTLVWDEENPGPGKPITITSKDIWDIYCSSKVSVIDESKKICSGPTDKCTAQWCYPGKLVDDPLGITYIHDKTRRVDCLSGGGASYPMTVKETCPNNTTLINGVCKRTTDVHKNYSCDKGTLNNNTCEIEEKVEAQRECPTDYTFNEECNTCVKVN